MELMTHTPVLIVGAGPAGLMMACELARFGVSFRIIDKNPERTLTSNAAGIQTRTLELFEQIGIIDRFLLKGLQCKAINISTTKIDVKLSFEQLDSIYHFILMLPQAETELILDQRLEQLEHHVERPLEFIQMNFSENLYQVKLKSSQDDIENITCDWLIACDGAHSTVRAANGLHFEGEDISEQFMVADAVMHRLTQSTEVHAFTNEGKALATFPLGHGKYRLAANLNQAVPRKIFTEREVKEIIMERSNGEFNVESVSWISPFWIHSKMLGKLRVDRTFFVGDAAHIHSPVGAQGMNTGIQDAYNLAWKLALVIHKIADEKLLDSYQAERLPIIKDIVKETERLTKILINNNKLFGIIRNGILKLVRHNKFILNKISMRISQLAICYKNSPIVQYISPLKHSPKPGDRIPNVAISHSAHLYDSLKNNKHTILLFSGTTADQYTMNTLFSLQKWIDENYPDIANTHIITNTQQTIPNTIYDVNNAIHKRFKIKNSAIYIVRPDNYIGAVANEISMQIIKSYFNGLFINR